MLRHAEILIARMPDVLAPDEILFLSADTHPLGDARFNVA